MRKQVRASRNAHGHHTDQNKGDTVRKAKDTHHFAFRSWSYRIDLAVATRAHVDTAGRIQKGQEMHPAPFEKKHLQACAERHAPTLTFASI